MEIKILNEKDAELLNRKEYKIQLDYNKAATPSNDNVKKTIAENLKVNLDLVKVKQINQSFGIGKANVVCYVYNNIESYKKFEEIKKKVKVKKEEAKKEEKK